MLNTHMVPKGVLAIMSAILLSCSGLSGYCQNASQTGASSSSSQTVVDGPVVSNSSTVDGASTDVDPPLAANKAGQSSPQTLNLPATKELLTPIRLIENHVSASYNPSIEWDLQGGSNGAGASHTTIRNGRAFNLYFVGPIAPHLSTYTQYTPLVLDHGVFTKFASADLRSNWGDSRQFSMVRGGVQLDLFEGGGFGLADRTVTQTTPLIWTAINGYDPTAASRGASIEYTLPGWTTAKTFMFFNQPTGDVNPKFERARGLGLIFEKLTDKKTLSGVQFQSVFGWTPTGVNYPFQFTPPSTGDPVFDQVFANGFAAGNGQPPPTDSSGNNIPVLNLNQINMSTNKFQRFYVHANKAFNDSKGFERVNAMFGFLLAHDSRNFSLTDSNNSLVGQRSVGYGYTFELLTIPIVRVHRCFPLV